MKDEAYQKALDDYTSSISLLVEKQELAGLINQIGELSAPRGKQFQKLGPEDTAVFGYMLLNYSLFERVYVLYSKKWIDGETWKEWHRWLKTMARHPMFQEVHNRSEGTFNKEFQKLVDDACTRAESA